MNFRITGDVEKLNNYETKKFGIHIKKFLERQNNSSESEAIINIGILPRSFKGHNLSKVKINLNMVTGNYYSNIKEFGPLKAVKQAIKALDFQIKKKTKV